MPKVAQPNNSQRPKTRTGQSFFHWPDVGSSALGGLLASLGATLASLMVLALSNFLTEGGLIRLMGGITREDFNRFTQGFTPAEGKQSATQEFRYEGDPFSTLRNDLYRSGPILIFLGECPSSDVFSWTNLGTARMILRAPAEPPGNCPAGTHAVQVDHALICYRAGKTENEKRADAGFLDGLRGMKADERFAGSAIYQDGYEEGVKERDIKIKIGENVTVNLCQFLGTRMPPSRP